MEDLIFDAFKKPAHDFVQNGGDALLAELADWRAHVSDESRAVYDHRILDEEGVIAAATPSPIAAKAAAVAPAKVYYVDATGGSDGNAGTAPDKAWKSLAKVNATAFAPGAKILFERGDTWTGSLVVPSAGESGKPIVFGAYGKGAAPVIEAGDGAGYAVTTNGMPHITFTKMRFTGADEAGMMLADAKHIRIVGTIVADNDGSGIVLSGTADDVGINRSKIVGNGEYGIIHHHYDNTNQRILNSEISGNGWRSDGGVSSGWHGRILSGEIAYNTIFNNGINGGDGRSHGLYHGEGQANSSLKIHDNHIHSNPSGAGILAKSSTQMFGNTINGNANVGISIGQNIGVSVTYKIHGNEIFDNGGGLLEHSKGGGSIRLELHDNAFRKNGGGPAISIVDAIDSTIYGNDIAT